MIDVFFVLHFSKGFEKHNFKGREFFVNDCEFSPER